MPPYQMKINTMRRISNNRKNKKKMIVCQGDIIYPQITDRFFAVFAFIYAM